MTTLEWILIILVILLLIILIPCIIVIMITAKNKITMATIKSYTDIEQSKKISEILPLESADMFHFIHEVDTVGFGYKKETAEFYSKTEFEYIPCWSLAALLSVLPKEIEIDGQHYAPCLFPIKSKYLLKLWYNSNYTITSPISIFSDNPVDACYEMILKLHELNLL